MIQLNKEYNVEEYAPEFFIFKSGEDVFFQDAELMGLIAGGNVLMGLRFDDWVESKTDAGDFLKFLSTLVDEFKFFDGFDIK